MTRVSLLSYLFAIVSGSSSPVQAGANAQLNEGFHNSIWATLVVYIVGILGLFVILLIARQAWPTAAIHQIPIPWWAWTGGLVSLVSTFAGLTLSHRMGSGMYTGMTLTASLLTSVLLDHFGLLGFPQHPATWPRLAGSALLILGIWLIARF